MINSVLGTGSTPSRSFLQLMHNGFGHSLHTAEKSGSYVPKGDMYPVLGRNNGLNSKEAQRRHALISRILRSVLFICPIDWTGLSHPEDAFDCSFWQQRFSLALITPSLLYEKQRLLLQLKGSLPDPTPDKIDFLEKNFDASFIL